MHRAQTLILTAVITFVAGSSTAIVWSNTVDALTLLLAATSAAVTLLAAGMVICVLDEIWP